MASTPVSKHPPIRFFLAIKPSNAALTQLDDLAKQLTVNHGGRKIKKEQIHLTLAFLGKITNDQLATLHQVLNNVTSQEFDLVINSARYWKRNQIIYAYADPCATELFSLAEIVRKTLTIYGINFDSRTYIPHITLVRKARSGSKLSILTKPVKWHVNEWFLIQSQQVNRSIKYATVGRWSLGYLSTKNSFL